MNRFKYRLNHIASAIVGAINRNGIDAFWEIRYSNSGDLVTPMLLKRYGFTPVHCYPREAAFFSCGSLLEKVPPDFAGFILGTGFMYHDSINPLKKARILALRGALSRDKIDAPRDTVLGDPGLLAARFISRRQKKRYKLGIVPHYVDKNDKRISQICEKYKHEVLFVDIQRHPLEVLRNIDLCETILSSSLHGLVFADSLDIPTIWVVLSDRVSGEGFKFQDYFSAFGKDRRPVTFTGDEALSDLLRQAIMPPSSAVEEAKNRLDHAFRRLREEVLHL